MKTIVIIGGTYQAAREELENLCTQARTTMEASEFIAQAIIDNQRLVAIGSSRDDVCWLRGIGFRDVEIITVEPELISSEMQKRINHVRSTNRKLIEIGEH